MRPDDNRPNPSIVVSPHQSDAPVSPRSDNRTEAEAIIRKQIDAIYANDPNATMLAEEAEPATAPTPKEALVTPTNVQATTQAQEVANPYERSHDERVHQTTAKDWQSYHSAWQSYYQQYYERYYVGQVHKTKKSLETQANVTNPDDHTISTDEAMYDLRSQLRDTITKRATKVRKSRHFLPTVAAVVVMLVFLFLQYNRVVFAAIDAYVTPGSLDPSTLIIDPNASTVVSSDPRLIIPKISVDVPIIWDANAADQNSLNAAMDKGVAWFDVQGASAHPGEFGNFALSGHSSNDWLDKGDYKFIFARLDQLAEGDTIYVNYNSTRYTYTVTKSQVVQPTDVSSLSVGIDKPRITLITCTPLGTALNRLLVFGDQVSPDPSSAAAAKPNEAASTATKIPSNSPTFLERIFGIGN